jgi:RNA polymerase sigma-70 factor (ECF subfamily)
VTEAAETARRVQAAVRSLPPPLREAVVLRYLEELPAEEVGAALGLSRAAVDVRLHRARERLKETLGSLWQEEKT